MRTKPIAVFLAFGTKGDVYPLSAIAAAFACDQQQYEVAFVTHAAHENLKGHLGAKGVVYFPISSPPVLSSQQQNDTGGGKWVNIYVNLSFQRFTSNLACNSVSFSYEISSVLPGSMQASFSLQKKEITRKHRRECLLVVERIYGGGPVMDGDLIIINFFALEGWSLAELFHVQCVVAAPYVVPYWYNFLLNFTSGSTAFGVME